MIQIPREDMRPAEEERTAQEKAEREQDARGRAGFGGFK
jgi:hypothetical protein